MAEYAVMVGIDITSAGIGNTYNHGCFSGLKDANIEAESIHNSTGHETYVVHYCGSPLPIIDTKFIN